MLRCKANSLKHKMLSPKLCANIGKKNNKNRRNNQRHKEQITAIYKGGKMKSGLIETALHLSFFYM